MTRLQPAGLCCRKILKKHDKMTNIELSGKLMPTVSDMLAKEQRKGALEGLKNSVIHEYALVAHSGGEPEAEQELGRHRRDQLTFERNTGLLLPRVLASSTHQKPCHPGCRVCIEQTLRQCMVRCLQHIMLMIQMMEKKFGIQAEALHFCGACRRMAALCYPFVHMLRSRPPGQ